MSQTFQWFIRYRLKPKAKYTRSYPKVPEIWILRPNGYEYIEIPLGVSPHTLLQSVWQAASSWVVGFIVGECISIVFPWLCGFAMADLREQRVLIKFCFRLWKTAAETHGMLKYAFGLRIKWSIRSRWFTERTAFCRRLSRNTKRLHKCGLKENLLILLENSHGNNIGFI
jgi:hypothetical protein